MCLKLANGWDQRHQSHWAEDTADNWEYFALTYVVEAIYPEFDFPYQPDPDGKFSFHPGRRHKSLRHHCSLLNCLRHVDLGSILDVDGYDMEQDPWLRRGNRPPTNKVELQKVLRKLTDDQSRQKRDIDRKLREKLGDSYEQDPQFLSKKVGMLRNNDANMSIMCTQDMLQAFMLSGEPLTVCSAVVEESTDNSSEIPQSIDTNDENDIGHEVQTGHSVLQYL